MPVLKVKTSPAQLAAVKRYQARNSAKVKKYQCAYSRKLRRDHTPHSMDSIAILSFSEIAELMGCTRQAAESTEKRAWFKIRRALRAMGIHA
jgi:hypothetical protein